MNRSLVPGYLLINGKHIDLAMAKQYYQKPELCQRRLGLNREEYAQLLDQLLIHLRQARYNYAARPDLYQANGPLSQPGCTIARHPLGLASQAGDWAKQFDLSRPEQGISAGIGMPSYGYGPAGEQGHATVARPAAPVAASILPQLGGAYAFFADPRLPSNQIQKPIYNPMSDISPHQSGGGSSGSGGGPWYSDMAAANIVPPDQATWSGRTRGSGNEVGDFSHRIMERRFQLAQDTQAKVPMNVNSARDFRSETSPANNGIGSPYHLTGGSTGSASFIGQSSVATMSGTGTYGTWGGVAMGTAAGVQGAMGALGGGAYGFGGYDGPSMSGGGPGVLGGYGTGGYEAVGTGYYETRPVYGGPSSDPNMRYRQQPSDICTMQRAR